MKKIFVLIMFGLIFSVTSVFAATITQSFNVIAAVAANCNFVSVNNLDFGTYDTTSATPNDASADFRFRCTKNTNYDIYISATRTMTGSPIADTLNYEIYSDTGRTTVWPSVSPGVTGTTPSNSPITLTMYGRIPALQDVSVGSYDSSTAPSSDPVITIEF